MIRNLVIVALLGVGAAAGADPLPETAIEASRAGGRVEPILLLPTGQPPLALRQAVSVGSDVATIRPRLRSQPDARARTDTVAPVLASFSGQTLPTPRGGDIFTRFPDRLPGATHLRVAPPARYGRRELSSGWRDIEAIASDLEDRMRGFSVDISGEITYRIKF